jgi:hypothetical protein
VNARRASAIVLTIVCALYLTVDGRAGSAKDAASPRAPERLSETGLYDDFATRHIAPGNRPFEPQYPLWTDGAEKARWIALPAGTAIDASDTTRWKFPVGTKLWKEFAFDGRKVETRMLWRATAAQWVFASYVWNDAQNEATLAPASGIRNHVEVRPGVKVSIPAEVECRACHESGGTPVLGFNALQLSDDRDPLALHAKPLGEASLTLRRMNAAAMLRPSRPDLVAHPPRIEARSARERAALGYLSTNCGSCHNARGPLAGLGLYLQHTDSRGVEHEPAVVTAIDIAGEYVTPSVAPEASRRIAPGAPDASAVVYRMSSRRPSSQMPPLGTAVVDTQALELIRGWIAEDLAPRKAVSQQAQR